MANDEQVQDAEVERDFQWAPIASVDDYQRGKINDRGQCFIDGHRVTTVQYEAFRKDWAAFYDASRCDEPNCDGDRGHNGQHFAWTAE